MRIWEAAGQLKPMLWTGNVTALRRELAMVIARNFPDMIVDDEAMFSWSPITSHCSTARVGDTVVEAFVAPTPSDRGRTGHAAELAGCGRGHVRERQGPRRRDPFNVVDELTYRPSPTSPGRSGC
jgi:hypothetical protein